MIVGAGIGGLAAAISLRRAGFEVEVVERAPVVREIGAGVSIWSNALAALDLIDVGDSIRSIGWSGTSGRINDRSGRTVASTDTRTIRGALGELPVMVHRAELLRVLLEAAGDISIRVAATCSGVRTEESQAVVSLQGGTELRADVVVGSDGIHSATRRALRDPSKPQYTGLTGWRAVIGNHDRVSQAWLSVSGGNQFLVAPLTEGRLFVASTMHLEEGQARWVSDPASYQREIFNGWHGPIDELLAHIPPNVFISSDIYHRPPPKWMARGRVALLGDAAHPMTPDLGQGACQAIEDSVVLGACLSGASDVSSALRTYESLRLPRVRTIVASSRKLGLSFSTRDPIRAAMRNTTLRLAPDSIRMRYLARFASRSAFLRSISKLTVSPSIP